MSERSPEAGTSDRSLRTLLAFAPIIFAIHFLEEAPGFVVWFNAHVDRGISDRLFWRVNLSALIITVLVAGANWVRISAGTLAIAVAWLGFLMAANALFHVTGAAVDRAYMPGLVTAVLLYVPYFALLVTRIVRSGALHPVIAALVAAIGALPMLVHGYRIVFLGTRLF